MAKRKASIGDLSADEAIADIEGLDEGEVPDKGKDHNPGRGIYRRQLEKFSTLPDDEKHKLLRETWKEVAMGTITRAKAFVSTCSPKDFGSLQRLVISSAVSLDKAFPPVKEPLAGPKFIVNLFGSLGPRAAAIATPPIPLIGQDAIINDSITREITWPSSSLTKTTTLLPTLLENSTTTTPSTPPLKEPLPQ
jgi:hypothetical protein